VEQPNNPPLIPPPTPSEPEAPAVPTTVPAETSPPAPQAAPAEAPSESPPETSSGTPQVSPEAPQAPAAGTGGLFGQSAGSALTAAPLTLGNDFGTTDLGSAEKSAIDWSGYIRNETAYRYKSPRSITKIRNTLYVRGDYAFNPTYKLTFAGWAYYDMVYDLYNYDTIAGRQVRNSDQPLAFIYAIGRDRDQKSLDARELYLDMHYSKMDVRLGRQFAVWGVLDGLRIVDEVQPQDFRELIMPDLLDYRIPTTMAKVDYYRKEGTYELIWQPEIRVNTPAPSGSEWELLQDVPGVRYPKQWDPLNANAGIRFSTNLWDTDVSFSYLYTYDDFPTVFRTIVLNQVNIAPVFIPQYNRIHMYGGTFSKQMGDYVLKGEMAYVTGKYFSVVNMDLNNDGILDHQGELKRSHLRYGVGLDFNWMGIDVSPSFSQWIIFNYNQYIVIHNYSTTLTLFLRKEIPQHSMLFECLAIGFPDLHEAYLNPRLTFFMNDHFKITTGLNMFWGRKSQFGVLANVNGAPETIDQENQFIGNFSDNDRVYVNLTYSF
jgi:hypothetical protein